MKSWGFSKFIAGDIAIFTKIDDEGNMMIILMYIDDMATFVSNMKLLDNFKA
jgi:hypothetical protein